MMTVAGMLSRLEASFRSDAILPAYARHSRLEAAKVRLNLRVRCIGPSRSPQTGGNEAATTV